MRVFFPLLPTWFAGLVPCLGQISFQSTSLLVQRPPCGFVNTTLSTTVDTNGSTILVLDFQVVSEASLSTISFSLTSFDFVSDTSAYGGSLLEVSCGLKVSFSFGEKSTHIHTHTYIYIYIYTEASIVKAWLTMDLESELSPFLFWFVSLCFSLVFMQRLIVLSSNALSWELSILSMNRPGAAVTRDLSIQLLKLESTSSQCAW